MIEFFKKFKEKIFNSLIKSYKKSNGSVAILVLIIGIAIVITLSTLSAYMINDIKFTKIDAERLRALNIAEAGLSDMNSNLYKYYNGDILELPASPYEGVLMDGEVIAGRYIIEYQAVYTEDVLSGYIINSTGIDVDSMVARKVGVKMNVDRQERSLGIYDYIYTGLSAVLGPNGNVMDGPFFTEGDLTIISAASMLQTNSSGPVVVRGNLTMDGAAVSITSEELNIGGNVSLYGSAEIKGGPVSIAGSLYMKGATLIGNPLISPLIVMGDITLEGSAQIGMPEATLTLSAQGIVNNPPAAPIYAVRDDSLTYTFIDPLFDASNLIDTYKTNVESTALVISENLVLKDTEGFSFSRSSGANSLSFYKTADDKWVLDISGNVIINGSLTIGGTSRHPLSTNTIYYTGKGTIYTSLDIISYAKLMPLPVIPERTYPEDDLLVLVSDKNITFDIFNFRDRPDCSSANIFVIAIAKGNISLIDGTIKGTAIAGGSLLVDKDFGKICYQEDLALYLPPDLPNNPSTNSNVVLTQVAWQELVP